MKFKNEGSEVYIADGLAVSEALSRTTHMGISAHQDDIEIMAYHGIVECFGKSDQWFSGVVVTNGAGSPRDDVYAEYTDDEMQKIRKVEQKKAAFVGEYGSQVLLDYTSSAVKDGKNRDVVEDIKQLLNAARPKVVYTHNLADKHDTHVSTALRIIQAIRELPAEARPETLYGCEVWRDLDWMTDEDKVGFDVSAHESLAVALLGVFDSQICGGKRYDLATMGRRRAHATYFASHGVDAAALLNFGMDMTPLIKDETLDPLEFVQNKIKRFAEEVEKRIAGLKG
ncbi:MAG: PIG-L family deacetylase [Armatimonadota bacterium]|nr:PIG-L family deacetylase [bacterium]